MTGENLNLSSDPDPKPNPTNAQTPRPFIGIRFACCDTYSRVYINRTETAYEGRCPKCCRHVRIRVGPGGTDQRFFTVY